ncbi:MAG: PEGA domain-containing protein [Deltaproteobacteria bacterium]|nr:MAG: PEGA domain-containing protein [Deltaproteobacteria bacterium]
MKTIAPLVIGFIAGLFGFSELYIEHEGYRAVFQVLSDCAIVLAAMAYVLGGINVVQVNWPKIRRRESDWQYKVVLLVGVVVMLVAGAYPWHKFGGGEPGRIAIDGGGVPGAPATVAFDVQPKYALVVVDGGSPQRAWHAGDPSDIYAPPGDRPLRVELAPGRHTVSVRMPVGGYETFTGAVDVTGGETVTVSAHLGMLWGATSPGTGRVYTWLYDYVFFPCNATMFSLLAFFIASAAFRAFRARSLEAGLLLGAAVLVMLGFVPIGGAIWSGFPEIAEWIMDVLNTTGRRAIIMGAALGAVATGLRVILGIERSHLGGGD